MFCTACGMNNADGARFCSGCGRPLAAPLTGEAPSPAAPSPVQPAPSPAPYTCAVCGYMLGPFDQVCGRCRTARGMRLNPQSPTPGAYVPAAGFALENTSGMQSTVPAEIMGGWNWGAFWFTWIWGVNHRAYITLVALMMSVLSLAAPLMGMISLGFSIYCGIKGNEWGWRNRRFDSVQHFKQVQRIWAYWVLGLFIVGVAFGILAILMLLIAFRPIAG